MSSANLGEFFNYPLSQYISKRECSSFPQVIAIAMAIVEAYEGQRIISADKMSNQRNPRDLSFGDQINYSDFSMLRHRPFKQNSFRNEWSFGDAMTKNRELRGQRAILRDNPLEGQSTSFASEIFEGQASTYRDQAPLKEQLFVAEAPFKNLLHAQSLSDEQTSFQKQAGFIEIPFASNSAKFYRDHSYDKPIDSYGRHRNMRTLPGETLYREYGGFYKCAILREKERKDSRKMFH